MHMGKIAQQCKDKAVTKSKLKHTTVLKRPVQNRLLAVPKHWPAQLRQASSVLTQHKTSLLGELINQSVWGVSRR